MGTVEIIVLVLWILAVFVAEFLKNAELDVNTNAFLQAYVKVVFMLAGNKILFKAADMNDDGQDNRVLYFNKETNRFAKNEDVALSRNRGTRIIQAITTVASALAGGGSYLL
ncbi:hypothetical protein [Vibrio phage BONAISHI]|nr:hypothetical protein [Vibrio phage BONAISHI]